MAQFRIQKQTEAEKDDYLIECFHDAGFIAELNNKNYSIISGRKGAGKTALARYLEKKSADHRIDLAYRVSVRNIALSNDAKKNERLNCVLLFLIIKTIQKLLDKNIFSLEATSYWKDFLIQNGLQSITDYETFIESHQRNKTAFSIKAKISSWLAGAEGGTSEENDSAASRAVISSSPASLVESLRQSLPEKKKLFIFLDDISDYLDDTNPQKLKEDISIIQDILLHLETYNSIFSDAGKQLRFISLLREDLFEFMEGSNVNKLRNDSLRLSWDEKSFASLLIKRLPFYQNDLVSHLVNPIESLRQQFPDEVFSETLKNFNTSRYRTNFYAYMVAISFNRPRDFLAFCYALRDRLSLEHPATFENIDAAEIEYSDYFIKELKDEMFLASHIFKLELNSEQLNSLIDILSQKNGFNSSQLRTDLGQYLGEKTSLGKKKIESFIGELWWYGILGFREDGEVIHFRYISQRPFLVERIKDYIFHLHRGLWWFSGKRKNKNKK